MVMNIAVVGDIRVQALNYNDNKTRIHVFSQERQTIGTILKYVEGELRRSDLRFGAIIAVSFLYDLVESRKSNEASASTLNMKDQIDYNGIINGVIACENSWRLLDRKIKIIWCIPYPIDFSRYNVSDRFDVDGSITRKFFGAVTHLKGLLTQCIPMINIFDLGDSFFYGMPSCKESFYSYGNINWPPDMTIDGIYPTANFVSRLIPKLTAETRKKDSSKICYNLPNPRLWVDNGGNLFSRRDGITVLDNAKPDGCSATLHKQQHPPAAFQQTSSQKPTDSKAAPLTEMFKNLEKLKNLPVFVEMMNEPSRGQSNSKKHEQLYDPFEEARPIMKEEMCARSSSGSQSLSFIGNIDNLEHGNINHRADDACKFRNVLPSGHVIPPEDYLKLTAKFSNSNSMYSQGSQMAMDYSSVSFPTATPSSTFMAGSPVLDDSKQILNSWKLGRFSSVKLRHNIELNVIDQQQYSQVDKRINVHAARCAPKDLFKNMISRSSQNNLLQNDGNSFLHNVNHKTDLSTINISPINNNYASNKRFIDNGGDFSRKLGGNANYRRSPNIALSASNQISSDSRNKIGMSITSPRNTSYRSDNVVRRSRMGNQSYTGQSIDRSRRSRSNSRKRSRFSRSRSRSHYASRNRSYRSRSKSRKRNRSRSICRHASRSKSRDRNRRSISSSRKGRRYSRSISRKRYRSRSRSSSNSGRRLIKNEFKSKPSNNYGSSSRTVKNYSDSAPHSVESKMKKPIEIEDDTFGKRSTFMSDENKKVQLPAKYDLFKFSEQKYNNKPKSTSKKIIIKNLLSNKKKGNAIPKASIIPNQRDEQLAKINFSINKNIDPAEIVSPTSTTDNYSSPSSSKIPAEDYSIENSLAILDTVADSLGVLGSALKVVVKDAREILPCADKVLKMLNDNDIRVLIDMCVDKMSTDISRNNSNRAIYERARLLIEWLLEKVDALQGAPALPKEEEKEVKLIHDLDIATISKVTLGKNAGETIEFIKNMLLYAGAAVTKETVNDVFQAVTAHHLKLLN